MNKLINKRIVWFKKYESMKGFTPEESWKIFKITAIGEAIGWTILIAGILINYAHLPGQNFSIPIAGQIHGSLFLLYFTSVFFLYPSLEWHRITFLFSLLAGVVPYGTLIFELTIARHRDKYRLTNERIKLLIKNNDKAIVAMLPHGSKWELPSILRRTDETRKKAASRLAESMFDLENVEARFYKKIGSDYIYVVNDMSGLFQTGIEDLAARCPYVDDIMIAKSSSLSELN